MNALLWASGGAVVCAAPGGQGPTDVVSDGSGGAIVAWVDGRISVNNTDIYARRVSAAGAPMWTADGNPVSTAPGNRDLVHERRMADGSTVIAWRDVGPSFSAASLYAQRVAGDGTLMWPGAGQAVGSSTFFIERFTMTAGVGDTTFVAWNTAQGAGGDVYAQKLGWRRPTSLGPLRRPRVPWTHDHRQQLGRG